MGFRFRKSINLGGGFKINLSKSGIGYSWGIPGYRITKTATGSTRKTYSIPGTGISYVDSFKNKKNSNTNFNDNGNNSNDNINYNDSTKLITGDVKYYQNINVSDMGKDDEILQQINKIKRINTLANILLFTFYLLPVGIVLKLLIAYKWKIDLSYEMDDINKKKFESLNEFLLEISKNKKIWQIGSSTKVYNSKYNAGASSNITRHRISIVKKMPWYITHNIDVYCLKLINEKIYFTPDRMLIFKSFGRVGGRLYNDMVANFSTTNFVETEIVPSDAEIINYTWRYVNKNGGPDKRFNNNRRIPVCKYGEIGLETSDGINILLECSNYKLMYDIQDKFTEFMKYHNKIISLSKCENHNDYNDDSEEKTNISENDRWNNYNYELDDSDTNNSFAEEKRNEVIVEHNKQEEVSVQGDTDEKASSSKFLNILCYIQVGLSVMFMIGCISDKMIFDCLLWLCVAIIFIPKIKKIIIKKYPKFLPYIIPVRIILIIIALVVLGITAPLAFAGNWNTSTNEQIVINRKSIMLITSDGNEYIGTYKYNSLPTNNSSDIYYEIIVNYEDQIINEMYGDTYRFYKSENEIYLCKYKNNNCIQYFEKSVS